MKELSTLYLSREGVFKDVDIYLTVSTRRREAQALVYESSTSRFKPGASGDSSFKLQSVNAKRHYQRWILILRRR